MANAFEKNNGAKKPASKGKVVTVVLLAAVLGGVLFFHFQNSAQTATAAEGGAPDVSKGSLQFNATAQIASLAQNPTKDLLLPRKNEPDDIANIPANPFAVSATWYEQLRKAQVSAPVLSNPITPNDTSVHLPTLNLDKIKADIKLQGIFRESNSRVAIVNGKTFRAGGALTTNDGNIQIVDILEDRLVCQVPGYGDSGKFDILLAPKAPGN